MRHCNNINIQLLYKVIINNLLAISTGVGHREQCMLRSGAPPRSARQKRMAITEVKRHPITASARSA
eukprot:737528-Pleurochrysis_carterae.AAC.2